MRNDMTEAEVTDKANMKMNDAAMTLFMQKYKQILSYILQLNKGALRKKILHMAEENIRNRCTGQKAVQLALKEFQEEKQEMLPENESDTDSNSDDDEEQDDPTVI